MSTWLTTSLIAAATSPGVSCSRTKHDPASNFECDPEAFKVAAVRKPPVGYVYHSLSNQSTWFNYNLSATITQSVDIIHQAAAEGVKFIAFPELYFPGYPTFRTPNGPNDFKQYVSQTMVFGGPEWQTLMQAFADTRMYGVIAWAERQNDSLFMSQTLVGPASNGTAEVIWRHQKFRPTGTERSLYSDGYLTSIRAQHLPFGTVSMLSCWEHVYPESRFIMSAQPANIHVASFPFGNDVPETDTSDNPYLFWRAATIGSAAGAAGHPATLLSSAGEATILQRGAPLNESLSNAKESTDKHPYVTAVLNTTSFVDTSAYSVNEWHSWGSLKSIMDGLPDDMPHTKGPFLKRVVFTIQQFTKGYIWTPTLSCTPTAKWPCIKIWPVRNESQFMESTSG